MPYTARAIERTRETGWSALTLYRGPLAGSTTVASGSPRAASQGQDAGALDRPTAPPPMGAALVAAGESIQAVMDARASAGGGWVVLGKETTKKQGVAACPEEHFVRWWHATNFIHNTSKRLRAGRA